MAWPTQLHGYEITNNSGCFTSNVRSIDAVKERRQNNYTSDSGPIPSRFSDASSISGPRSTFERRSENEKRTKKAEQRCQESMRTYSSNSEERNSEYLSRSQMARWDSEDKWRLPSDSIQMRNEEFVSKRRHEIDDMHSHKNKYKDHTNYEKNEDLKDLRSFEIPRRTAKEIPDEFGRQPYLSSTKDDKYDKSVRSVSDRKRKFESHDYSVHDGNPDRLDTEWRSLAPTKEKSSSRDEPRQKSLSRGRESEEHRSRYKKYKEEEQTTADDCHIIRVSPARIGSEQPKQKEYYGRNREKEVDIAKKSNDRDRNERRRSHSAVEEKQKYLSEAEKKLKDLQKLMDRYKSISEKTKEHDSEKNKEVVENTDRKKDRDVQKGSRRCDLKQKKLPGSDHKFDTSECEWKHLDRKQSREPEHKFNLPKNSTAVGTSSHRSEQDSRDARNNSQKKGRGNCSKDRQDGSQIQKKSDSKSNDDKHSQSTVIKKSSQIDASKILNIYQVMSSIIDHLEVINNKEKLLDKKDSSEIKSEPEIEVLEDNVSIKLPTSSNDDEKLLKTDQENETTQQEKEWWNDLNLPTKEDAGVNIIVTIKRDKDSRVCDQKDDSEKLYESVGKEDPDWREFRGDSDYRSCNPESLQYDISLKALHDTDERRAFLENSNRPKEIGDGFTLSFAMDRSELNMAKVPTTVYDGNSNHSYVNYGRKLEIFNGDVCSEDFGRTNTYPAKDQFKNWQDCSSTYENIPLYSPLTFKSKQSQSSSKMGLNEIDHLDKDERVTAKSRKAVNKIMDNRKIRNKMSCNKNSSMPNMGEMGYNNIPPIHNLGEMSYNEVPPIHNLGEMSYNEVPPVHNLGEMSYNEVPPTFTPDIQWVDWTYKNQNDVDPYSKPISQDIHRENTLGLKVEKASEMDVKLINFSKAEVSRTEAVLQESKYFSRVRRRVKFRNRFRQFKKPKRVHQNQKVANSIPGISRIDAPINPQIMQSVTTKSVGNSSVLEVTLKDIIERLKHGSSADPAGGEEIMKSLSLSEQNQVQQIQKMTGIQNIHTIVTVMKSLWSLDPSIVQTLGSMQPEMIKKLSQ